ETAVKLLADPATNSLLVQGPPKLFAEVLRAVEHLDRPARGVAVEVWLIEVADTKGDKEVELPDLGGPLAAVAGKVEALEKKGLLAAVKHIHVLAAENRTACGYVGGVTVTATGIATKSTFRRTTGTNMKVTPRLPSDKQIILDLRVEDS